MTLRFRETIKDPVSAYGAILQGDHRRGVPTHKGPGPTCSRTSQPRPAAAKFCELESSAFTPAVFTPASELRRFSKIRGSEAPACCVSYRRGPPLRPPPVHPIYFSILNKYNFSSARIITIVFSVSRNGHAPNFHEKPTIEYRERSIFAFVQCIPLVFVRCTPSPGSTNRDSCFR